MWRLADRHIDEFIADGKCEFLAAYARPFSLLVVADLLGVPEEDHEEFREAFGAQRPGTNIGGLDHEPIAANPLEWADEKPVHYIEDRRRPRDDVLTGLATAQYPDGSTPRSSTSSAPRRSCSGPARRPPPSCSARRCGCSATVPTSATAARRPQSDSHFHRGVPTYGQPGEERFPAGPQEHDAGRHPGARRHDCDGQSRRGEPRSAPVRATRTSSSSIGKTSVSTSRSAAESTPARAHR